MTTFLFLGLICSGVVMLLALTGLTDFGETWGDWRFQASLGGISQQSQRKGLVNCLCLFSIFLRIVNTQKISIDQLL